MPSPRRLLASLGCAFLTACGAGSGATSTPIGGANVPPELLACRARVDQPFTFAEVALRSSRNLGTSRLADRSGTERHARQHPDGNTVVFARERSNGDPTSRELFTAVVDGSRAEQRLTQNSVLDDEPCWSPNGANILFASDRTGPKSLWLVDLDGSNPRVLLDPPAGASDGEPDWCRATDRIVWSRRDAAGHHGLWLAQGNGTGSVPLTDGGATVGDGTGDLAPAFAADGGRIVFVRRTAPGLASLCLVDVNTGTVQVRLQPNGDVGTPRWAPAMDRLFFGLAEPAAGRATLRLACLPVTTGEPVLLWPDQRWQLEGLDILPGLASAPSAGAPQRLDVEKAQLQIAAGSSAFGVLHQFAEIDNSEYVVFTETLEGREIAGINCRFDLPVATAEDVVELRIQAVARTTRIGTDSHLRMSIYNPVDSRFDTVVDQIPTTTAASTMTFTTSSLRHLTQEKQLRVTVIGDLEPGPRSELHIDLVEVVLVPRAGP